MSYRQLVTWGYYYWPVFLILVSLGFLPAELYAVFTNTSNTLSDYAWYELGVNPSLGKPLIHSAAWFLTQGVYLVMVAWLWRHIWFRQYT